MATVLVTGAAGFLGHHICERLLADGHSVYAVDNLSSGKDHKVPVSNGIIFRTVDCTSRALNSAFDDKVEPEFAVLCSKPEGAAVDIALHYINELQRVISLGVRRILLIGFRYSEMGMAHEAGKAAAIAAERTLREAMPCGTELVFYCPPLIYGDGMEEAVSIGDPVGQMLRQKSPELEVDYNRNDWFCYLPISIAIDDALDGLFHQPEVLSDTICLSETAFESYVNMAELERVWGETRGGCVTISTQPPRYLLSGDDLPKRCDPKSPVLVWLRDKLLTNREKYQ